MSAEATWVLEEETVGGRSSVSVTRTVHVCASCRQRRSLSRHGGVVKADGDHTLCFQCFRALQNRVRARRLAGVHRRLT
jgi:hypothetical protein